VAQGVGSNFSTKKEKRNVKWKSLGKKYTTAD
jgi:hypothetical protein